MTEQQKEKILDLYHEFFHSLDEEFYTQIAVEKMLEILELKVDGINE